VYGTTKEAAEKVYSEMGTEAQGLKPQFILKHLRHDGSHALLRNIRDQKFFSNL